VRVSGQQHAGAKRWGSGQGKRNEDGCNFHDGQNSFGFDNEQNASCPQANEQTIRGPLAQGCPGKEEVNFA